MASENEIVKTAQEYGYNGSGFHFDRIDEFLHTIGLCLIYDEEEDEYYIEPWH